MLATDRTVPLIVGGRQTMVGRASGTSRSMANFLRPVTMSSASTRPRGVPMTVNSDRGFSATATCRVRSLAAVRASSP